jgi:hypothetical protein
MQALEASMINIGSSLDSSLRSRAQNLHDNSKQLEKQQKDVVKATEALRKETEKLKKVADEGMRKVKELGNVQNWAEMLERDFLVLSETLRLVEKGSDEESDWETEGSYSGSDEEMEGAGGEGGGREGEEAKKVVDEEPGLKEEMQVDAEGDTTMDGTEHEDKGKGKEAEVPQQPLETETYVEAVGGSSTATTGSSSDQSSSSVHTSASAAS